MTWSNKADAPIAAITPGFQTGFYTERQLVDQNTAMHVALHHCRKRAAGRLGSLGTLLILCA
jgi:hypothetical protein